MWFYVQVEPSRLWLADGLQQLPNSCAHNFFEQLCHLTLAASLDAFPTKSGKWTREQVGVKAPGTPTSTPFLPPHKSFRVRDLTEPSSSSRLNSKHAQEGYRTNTAQPTAERTVSTGTHNHSWSIHMGAVVTATFELAQLRAESLKDT